MPSAQLHFEQITKYEQLFEIIDHKYIFLQENKLLVHEMLKIFLHFELKPIQIC